MKSTLILLLIAITFSTFSVTAQHSYIPSERTFTTKDGLSSDKIHALHKDNQGFIWIGTENGLDRFDGQNFLHFNKNTHPEMTLDRVQFIAEDDEGYLWLLEKNKPFEHYFINPTINFYHPQTGKWTTVEERFGKSIATDLKSLAFVKLLENGSIFLFMNEKGKVYSYQNGEFQKYLLPKELARISDAKVKKNGTLFLEGVPNKEELQRFIFKINTEGQITQKLNIGTPLTLQTKQANSHFQLKAKGFLVGAKNLDAFDLFYPNAQPPTLTNQNAIKIGQTDWNKDKELLWLKSQYNLYITQANGQIIYQKSLPQDQFEMPIVFDGNTTWYSDKQNGLVALTLQPNHFQTYQQFKEGFNNSARGIYADTKGNIWISTISGVLHKTANSKAFEFEKTHIFTSFLKDKNNQLWSLGEEAFNSFNFSTGKKENISFPGFHIHAWSMYQAENGEIWAYGNGGLRFVFNPTTLQTRIANQLPVNIATFYVYDIQKKDAHSVWLCTNQGLYLVDNQGKFIAQYNKEQKDKFYLPTNDIHHLYKDRNGTIWLATGDAGLIQLTTNGERLTVKSQFTTENGLSCDILHSVYEDDFEYLWLSSNEGLMQFDKRTGKVVTYTTEEGLLHNEFNRISHFQAEDGTLYFGGLTGVISFHPKHFSQVRHEGRQAALVVTNFQQFSAKKRQFENLTEELTQKRTIRLQHNDRFFKLNIALLDFKSKATYQYRIKNLYDWQTTRDSELNISGLPYGKYTLEIKAFNNNQNEAANSLSFDIQVLKPFYLQWWFLILVLGGLGTIAFYFIKWRTQQMLVYQETEQLRQLDKLKSQFFANISHELRTPITLILGPLAQLIKNYKQQSHEKIDQQLLSIQYNGKSLLNLVNEVLDLSKLEANKLELHRVPTKIPQFIERVVANFESAARVKDIEYQFISFLQKNVIAQFDQPKLEKILNNLLSNALKFTPKDGAIQIMVGQINDDLIIKVKDSGKGISTEDLPHVFDRYFQTQSKSNQGGTGIGLALTKELVELMNGEILVQSELGEGTVFEVRLPIQLAVNQSAACLPKHDRQVGSEQLVVIEETNLRGFENLLGLEQQKTGNSQQATENKDTILLVEDNPSLQQFIQSILAPHYNVIVSNNGLEALNYLTNHQSPITNSSHEARPSNHLILSDVMMPEMDGFTLLEKVKSDDKFCSIPFVLLTARADINDKLRGLRIGVDDYMTKPFEVEELLLRIKNLIANTKSRQLAVGSEQLLIETDNEKQPKEKQKTDDNQLATRNSQPATVEDLEWLEKVEQLVQKELRNSQLSVDFLANELYISQRQLYRKIKKITGMTPHQYIKNFRLQIAKRILETEDVYTLTEVCNAVGLENTTHFAKAYEKAFGKRPHSLLQTH